MQNIHPADLPTLTQIKPLTDFLSKHAAACSDADARASFTSHLTALRQKWRARLSPEQREKGIAQIEQIRQLLAAPEMRTKDNRTQYTSKLQQLGA